MNQLRSSRRPALEEVEPEITDVGIAVTADDHVVAIAGCQLGEVGIERRALAIESKQSFCLHCDDEQVAVGKPTESRRLILDADDHIPIAIGRDGVDAVLVEVGVPELVVVPTRSFSKAWWPRWKVKY